MTENILSRIDSKISNRNINLSWLPYFRIFTSLFCILHFLALLPDAQQFLSDAGLIAPDIIDAKASSVVPTMYDISLWINYPIDHIFLNVFSGVYLSVLLMLFFGIWSNFTAIICALLHIILYNSMHYYVYGVDNFCTIALFYCVVFPVHKNGSFHFLFFSIKSKVNTYANYCLLLLQTHVCIVYFFSGLDKSLGYNWWNGESIWKSLHLVDSPHLLNFQLYKYRPFFIIMGCLTFIAELVYPVFVNIPRTRKLFLGVIITLHLSIAIFLGLFFFATFMIILNVCAYYLPYAQRKEVKSVTPANLNLTSI